MIASNTSAPNVVVFGATGVQGSSVIKALIKSPKEYRVTAVTRDTSKPAAQKLTGQGCSLVKADASKEEDLEKLFATVGPVDILFLVTAFWEHASKDKEVHDGELVVDQASESTQRSLV